MVELARPEGDEHRLVLLLHQSADFSGHLLVAQVLGVRGLRGADDAPAVGEEMSDDVRMLDARVFRLDVKDASLVSDVVVEAEERRGSFHRRDISRASNGVGRPRGASTDLGRS
jgi:hypothetical protein